MAADQFEDAAFWARFTAERTRDEACPSENHVLIRPIKKGLTIEKPHRYGEINGNRTT
jgi:hypothetical protein